MVQFVEFYGNFYQVYCIKCGQYVDWYEYLKFFYYQIDYGYLWFNVVLYDEGIVSVNIEWVV